MKAIGVRKYGGVDVFEELDVEKPKVNSHDILIKVKACSVNPIDVKVRGGVYDDYPDYYSHTPMDHDKYQILGFDGSGVIEELGSDVDKKKFQKGDEVYYLAAPFRQAGNADYVAVVEYCVALKPKNLSFEEAAGVPLTGLTAHQSLVERLEIKEGEQCGILIINGAGGVGSIAIQICSKVLKLPVIIATASKEESSEFAKKMGATHVVNYREDIPKQIAELKLTVPLKYAYITHTTVDEYVKICAQSLSPMGKMCSIVQGHFDMYGTQAMAKSLTFAWGLLGTIAFYNIETNYLQETLSNFTKWYEDGLMQATVTKVVDFNLENLRKVHETVEKSGSIGKIVLKMK